MEDEDPPPRPGIEDARLRNGPPALFLEEKTGEVEENSR
jgi:hypothetical protein